jgi:hypothetical protein
VTAFERLLEDDCCLDLYCFVVVDSLWISFSRNKEIHLAGKYMGSILLELP